MSMNEFRNKKQNMVRDQTEKLRRKKHEWKMEKGEGSEALLGSMNTYAGQTVSVFLIPLVLLFIIFFA